MPVDCYKVAANPSYGKSSDFATAMSCLGSTVGVQGEDRAPKGELGLPLTRK